MAHDFCFMHLINLNPVIFPMIAPAAFHKLHSAMEVFQHKNYIVPILFLSHTVEVQMYYSDWIELCFDLTCAAVLTEIPSKPLSGEQVTASVMNQELNKGDWLLSEQKKKFLFSMAH